MVMGCLASLPADVKGQTIANEKERFKTAWGGCLHPLIQQQAAAAAEDALLGRRWPVADQ